MTSVFDGRILVLLEHARLGGGTLVAHDLIREWVRGGAGVQTLVLGLVDEPMRFALAAEAEVEVLELEGSGRRLIALRRRLADLGTADVVFAVGDYCGPLAAAALATLPPRRRPAIVIGEHQPRPLMEAVREFRGPLAARFAGRLEAALRLRTAGSVFTAAGQGPASAAWVASGRPATVIPNPSRMEAAAIDSIEARLSRLERREEVRLIVVGALNAQKDHATLLEAVRRLPPRFRLTVVGNGDEDRVRRTAEELALSDRVTITGPRDDVRDQLDEHDVFVLSSRWETAYPLVVIEAIARGLPVVSTACSPVMAPFAAAVPTVGLTDVGDPAGLADAIVAVAEAPPSAEALASAAATLVERHDPARAAGDHLVFFAGVTRR